MITELVAPKTKILFFQTSPPSQIRQTLGESTPIQTQLVLQFAQDPCREQSTYGESSPPQTLGKMGCLFSILQFMSPVYKAKQLNKVVHASDSSTQGLRLEDQELQVSLDCKSSKSKNKKNPRN